MTVVGTLRLSRDRNGLGYAVFIDGVRRGSLAAGEEQAYALAPGRHAVEVKVHRAGSPTVHVDIEPARTVHMRASRASKAPWLLGRTDYLALTPAT